MSKFELSVTVKAMDLTSAISLLNEIRTLVQARGTDVSECSACAVMPSSIGGEDVTAIASLLSPPVSRP